MVGRWIHTDHHVVGFFALNLSYALWRVRTVCRVFLVQVHPVGLVVRAHPVSGANREIPAYLVYLDSAGLALRGRLEVAVTPARLVQQVAAARRVFKAQLDNQDSE